MGEAQFSDLIYHCRGIAVPMRRLSGQRFRSQTKRLAHSLSLSARRALKDFVEVGTPLDAKVSRELLLSIFHPTSPIHDGAVVIKGNRIAAAGCFLPITMSADISKSFGTRHRAALGLSEETDAVIVIVSEETGTFRWLSTEHLKLILIWERSGMFLPICLRRRKEMKKLFFENLGLKIASVLLAIVLWFLLRRAVSRRCLLMSLWSLRTSRKGLNW